LNLSYAYIELRNYKDAIDCLDECALLAEDKVADVYFRRSQARTYNRFSSFEDLELAKKDIIKAIDLKNEDIYLEHYKRLMEIDNRNHNVEKRKIISK